MPRRAALTIALALAACHPKTSVAVGDASAPSSSAKPASARGKPFVLAMDHSIIEALWLPNGHVGAVSRSEIFDVDLATGEARRVPLERTPRYLRAGAPGTKRFVIDEDGSGVTVWDAEKLAPVKHIARLTFPVVSPDGTRMAAWACEEDGRADCEARIFDMTTGDVAATITGLGKRLVVPEPMIFSESGRFAYVPADKAMAIADAATGKVIVRRRARRASDNGTPTELVAFRGERVILTSANGLEVVALPSGKVEQKVADPFGGEWGTTFAVDANGTQVGIYSGTREKVFLWSLGPKPTSRTFAGDAGTVEAIDAPPGASRYAASRTPCRLYERESGHTLLEHPAICPSEVTERHGASFSPDAQHYLSVYEGAVHVFSVEKKARVSGFGALTSEPYEHLEKVVVVGETPALGKPEHRLWLTKTKPPPEAPLPRDFRFVRVTKTHTWAVSQKAKTARVVVALDRAGKEVLHEEVHPFEEMLEASDGTAFLRDGPSAIRCDVGRGCKSVELGGFIASFDYPWLLLGARAGDDSTAANRLLNIDTNERRPLPGECHGNAHGNTVFRDGPTVLCNLQGTHTLVGGDAGALPITLGPHAPKNAGLSARSGPFLFFSGVENTGHTPAHRIDMRSGKRVDLFLGKQHGVALFADDKIERFGDPALSEQALRCLDGDRVLAWSACKDAFEVSGRFDGL